VNAHLQFAQDIKAKALNDKSPATRPVAIGRAASATSWPRLRWRPDTGPQRLAVVGFWDAFSQHYLGDRHLMKST